MHIYIYTRLSMRDKQQINQLICVPPLHIDQGLLIMYAFFISHYYCCFGCVVLFSVDILMYFCCNRNKLLPLSNWDWITSFYSHAHSHTHIYYNTNHNVHLHKTQIYYNDCIHMDTRLPPTPHSSTHPHTHTHTHTILRRPKLNENFISRNWNSQKFVHFQVILMFRSYIVQLTW